MLTMGPGWHDTYARNKGTYGPDELRPFQGHFVAWNLEGHPVAHDADLEVLARKVEALGYASDQVIHDYIPEGDLDIVL